MQNTTISISQLRNRVALTAIAIIVLLTLSACDFVKTSYRTIGTVVLTVDFAKKGYLDFYDAGKISPEVDKEVERAYATYQDAARASIAAVRTYSKLSSPTETDKAKVDFALAQLRVVSDSLLNLFSRYGVDIVAAKNQATPETVDSFVKSEAAKGVN